LCPTAGRLDRPLVRREQIFRAATHVRAREQDLMRFRVIASSPQAPRPRARGWNSDYGTELSLANREARVQQAIWASGSARTLEGQAITRGGACTAAVARVAAKFVPVSRPRTEKLAPELGTAPTRARKRKLWDRPLTRSVSDQHRRDVPLVAPGAEINRSPDSSATQTFGSTPGTGLVTPAITTNSTDCPAFVTGRTGTIRSRAAVRRGVTVEATIAKSPARCGLN
jgi:hypothetical protein